MTTTARTELLAWFGLLGAPLAWAVELVVGYGWEEAACAPAGMRWNLGTTWAHAGVFAAAAAVALAALVSAASAWHAARRGAGDARGRVEFMSAGGIFVSALFLAAVVMTGGGTLALEPCAPS